jgi:hypothetical protein
MPLKIASCIFLLILALASVLTGCSNNNYAEVVLYNRSNQEIAEVSIELSGDKRNFKNINPGEAIQTKFENIPESHFVLQGRLKDGTRFQGDFGYLTPGFNYNNVFIVNLGGEIEFETTIK